MRPDSIVFAIAGMCFGVILGWVIGVQQAGGRFTAAPAAAAAAPAQGGGGWQPQAPPLDEARVQSLMTVIKNDPKNAGAAVQLGNTYFDAERYPDAIKWYQESLRIDPSNPDASTDLGVSLYYTGQTDRALQQFDAVAEAESKAHQDAAEPGHRPRVRQAGSRRRPGGVEAGRRARPRQPRSAGGAARARRDYRGRARRDAAGRHPRQLSQARS